MTNRGLVAISALFKSPQLSTVFSASVTRHLREHRTDKMTGLTAPSREELTAAIKAKTVLITGGAAGIGLATAKLFAAAGAQVIIADVGGEHRLQSAAAEVGCGCGYYECDVSSWDQQMAMFEMLNERYGGADVVFLNADVHLEMATAGETAVAEEARKWAASDVFANEMTTDGKLKAPIRNTFDVNLLGVVDGMKLAVHWMKKRGRGGRSIATVSANAYMAIPGSSVYDASKHGVLGFMRSAAQRLDLQEAGICISALCPSLTRTAMTAPVAREHLVGIKSSEPSDFACGVGWAVVNAISVVNGTTVMVKGQDLLEVEASYRQWMLPIFAG